MATLPTTVVEIEFTAGAWTDVTAYVDAAAGTTIARGRASQSDDGQPGTLSLTFLNDDGRFTPDNPAGAYYPNLVTDKRIRFTANSSVRFLGWINDFVPKFPDGNAQGNPTTAVTATDSLGRLARARLPDCATTVAVALGAVRYFPLTEPATTTLNSFTDYGSDLGSYYHFSYTPITRAATANLGADPVLLVPDGTTSLVMTVPPGPVPPASNVSSYDFYSYVLYSQPKATTLAFWAITPAGFAEEFEISYSQAILYFESGLLKVFNNSTTPTVQAMPTDALPHHYVVTWDLTTLTVYVDGDSVYSSAWASSGTVTKWLHIRYANDYNTPGATMTLGHIGAWNSALTAREVASLYAGGGGAITPDLANDTTGSRIAGICDQVGVTTTATGGKKMGAAATNGVKALDAIATLARGDTRIVYDNGGTVVFRSDANPATPAVTLDGEADLSGSPTWGRSSQGRFRSVTASSVTGGAATATDSTSPITDSTSITVANVDPVDLAAVASRAISDSRDTRLRIVKASVDIATSTATYADMSALVLGDRVRFSGLPSDLLGWTYQDGYLLGQRERYAVGACVFEMDLGPADAPSIGIADDDSRDRARAGSGVMTLNGSLTSSATSASIASTGATLTLDAGAYPLDLDIDGERVTISSAPGSAVSPQTVTITRGVAPSVARAHSSGVAVDVYLGARAGY